MRKKHNHKFKIIRLIIITVYLGICVQCHRSSEQYVTDLIDYYFLAYPSEECLEAEPIYWQSLDTKGENTVIFQKPGTVNLYVPCSSNARLFCEIGSSFYQQTNKVMTRSKLIISVTSEQSDEKLEYELLLDEHFRARDRWSPILLNLYRFREKLIKLSFAWTSSEEQLSYAPVIRSLVIVSNQPIREPAFLNEPKPSLTGANKLRTAIAGNNLIILLIDALRADKTGFNGSPEMDTPYMDLLSKTGITFEHVISSSSWTKPAVGTLFTGLYPYGHGAFSRNNSLTDQCPTLAELFHSKGYATYGITANATISDFYGFGRGFDDLHLSSRGYFFLHDQALTDLLLINLNKIKYPFFYYVHYVDPHFPYKPAVITRYQHPCSDIDASSEKIRDCQEDSLWFKQQQKEINYQTEITETDKQIGRVITYLSTHKILKKTSILLISDHGEEFYEHGHIGHGKNLYHEVIEVPSIFVPAAQVNYPSVVNETVRYIDLLPTLADIFQLPLPADDVHGKSIVANVFEPDDHTRKIHDDCAFLHLDLDGKISFSCIIDDYKIIKSCDGPFELYKIKPFYMEQVNLAQTLPIRLNYYRYLLQRFCNQLQQERQYLRSIENEDDHKERQFTPEIEENLRALGYLK